MTTDYRALCIELTDCLEKSNWPLRHRYVFRQWIDIARAALADGPAVPEGREPASVTGQPTRRQLMILADEMGMASIGDAALYARAVLTRWGNPAPQPPAEGKEEQVWPPSVADGCHRGALSAAFGSPEQRLLVAAGNTIENLWQKLHWTVSVQAAPVPAEGEAAELVAWLKKYARSDWLPDETADKLTRAADLLQRLSPPQPVPVSERLPGPEDCDVEGRCWLWERDCGYSGCKWALVDRTWSLSQSDEDLSVYTHWLPSNALPLPEQEVSK